MPPPSSSSQPTGEHPRSTILPAAARFLGVSTIALGFSAAAKALFWALPEALASFWALLEAFTFVPLFASMGLTTFCGVTICSRRALFAALIFRARV